MSTLFPNYTVSPDEFDFNVDAEAETPQHINDSYVLQELNIKIKNGTEIAIGNSFTRMEIYEDIFSPSINGKITMNDFVGGHEKFLFTGGEQIKLRVLKPNNSNEILISRDDLIVYEISKIKFDADNTAQYDIFFTSKSAIASQKKRIFKSFGSDRGVVSVCRKIYSDINAVSNLNISAIDAGLNMQNRYLSPGYTPLEALSMIARRACYLGDYYVFYEKLGGRNNLDFKHVFIGLSNLKSFWQSRTIPRIVYQPAPAYFTNAGGQSIIQCTSFQIDNNFKHLEKMQAGFYNSRVRQINPLARRFNDIKISYEDIEFDGRDFYNNRILNTDNEFLTYDDSYPEYPGERLIVRPQNDIVYDKKRWVAYDTYGGLLNSGLRVLVDIPGGSNRISTGYAVELSIPSKVAKTLNLEQAITPEDEMYSGKYLVTAIRHIFTQTTYIKKCELSRGSIRINLDSRIEATS